MTVASVHLSARRARPCYINKPGGGGRVALLPHLPWETFHDRCPNPLIHQSTVYVALFAFYQLNGEVTVALFIYWVYIRYDFWVFSFTSDFTKTLVISLQMYIFSFRKKICIVISIIYSPNQTCSI